MPCFSVVEKDGREDISGTLEGNAQMGNSRQPNAKEASLPDLHSGHSVGHSVCLLVALSSFETIACFFTLLGAIFACFQM